MLLIATQNKGKIAEFKQLLKGSNLTTPQDLAKLLPKNFTVKETGKTFKQNAILKAKAYGQKTNLSTIADDTGLIIDALDGQPGIKSARFAKGDFEAAKQKILKLLKEVKKGQRTAKFISCLALYNSQTHTTKAFTGQCLGLIATRSLGKHGFGYDSIFIPAGFSQTMAQIKPHQKSKISHRAKALKKLKSYLQKNLVV